MINANGAKPDRTKSSRHSRVVPDSSTKKFGVLDPGVITTRADMKRDTFTASRKRASRGTF